MCHMFLRSRHQSQRLSINAHYNEKNIMIFRAMLQRLTVLDPIAATDFNAHTWPRDSWCSRAGRRVYISCHDNASCVRRIAVDQSVGFRRRIFFRQEHCNSCLFVQVRYGGKWRYMASASGRAVPIVHALRVIITTINSLSVSMRFVNLYEIVY